MYRSIRNLARFSTIGVATSALVTTLAAASFAGHTAEGYPGEPPLSRQCFMEQSHWNHVIDGPQPLCPGVNPDDAAPDDTTTDDSESLQLRRYSRDWESNGYGPMQFTY